MTETTTATEVAKKPKVKKAKAAKPKAKKPKAEKPRAKPVKCDAKGSFDYITLGADIFKFREKNDLSFGAIQEKYGIAKSTLQGAEAGQKELYAGVIARVCVMIGQPPAKYFKK